MLYQKKTVKDIDVSGKRVLVRCDFNVPQDENGAITNDKRVVASLPTIRYLMGQNAKVILCSHLGRPKGKVNPKYTLQPVANLLSALLNTPVLFASDVIGPDAKEKVSSLQNGGVCLLENVRFHAEEEKNDAAFAKELSLLADIFVSDAFGTSHRAHASTAGVADYIPAVAGYLIEKEINTMGAALADPKRPFVAILGGAKVSDKIGVINNLLEKVDTLIIGGAMAYTFLKSTGARVGLSKVEDDKLDYAKDMIQKAKDKGVSLLLPIDNVCADKFAADAAPVVYDSMRIPDDLMGLDIGPKTRALFADAITGAGTVIWNGPMGVFEFDTFAEGTRFIAEAIAKTHCISIIGGGDSAAAVEQLGYADKMTHISTGGGASLEFLEGLTLPGIACLLDKN